MASTVGWAASPSAVLQEVRTYKVTRVMLTRCLASVFFVTYETLKTQLSKALYPESASNAVGESPAVHMMAGSAAEVAGRHGEYGIRMLRTAEIIVIQEVCLLRDLQLVLLLGLP